MLVINVRLYHHKFAEATAKFCLSFCRDDLLFTMQTINTHEQQGSLLVERYKLKCLSINIP